MEGPGEGAIGAFVVAEKAQSSVGGDSNVQQILRVGERAEVKQIQQGTVEGEAETSLYSEKHELITSPPPHSWHFVGVDQTLQRPADRRPDQFDPFSARGGWAPPAPKCHSNVEFHQNVFR